MKYLPPILPGTWISAQLWPHVDPRLPSGSVVHRTGGGNPAAWEKREDGEWHPVGDGSPCTAFATPVVVVRIGQSVCAP